jgi:hypothetical protein
MRLPSLDNVPAEVIRVRFRAKNKGGAKVLHDYLFAVRDGKVVRAKDARFPTIFTHGLN